MRILDQNDQEIQSPDLELGYLKNEDIFAAHHEAVEAVAEQWHYETIAEYPNGGRDVEKVVDVPGVEAKDAWDEYETIRRYVPYTQEELDAMQAEKEKPTLEDRVGTLEEATEDMILLMAELIGGD